jgi:hypothetical protein
MIHGTLSPTGIVPATPRSLGSTFVAAMLTACSLGGMVAANDDDRGGRGPDPLVPASFRAESPYAGDRVVRVELRDARDLRTMLALSEDLWSHRVAVDLPADFRIDEAAWKALQATDLEFEVLIEDLGSLVAAERARLADAADADAEGGLAGASFFDDFRDLAAIETRLDELAALHPERATVLELGTSIEGRPIRAIRIAPEAGADLPHVVINSAQHAREWATPMTAMWLVEALLDASDPAVAAVAEAAIWTVLPVVNPDGYEFSWTDQRLWRKNRRDNGDGTFGVDLNRNWAWGWGGPGSSGQTSSQTYRGTGPFSEPETTALATYLESLPEVAAHLDVHSYGQWILHPWGDTADPPPAIDGFTVIGDSMADAIAAVDGRTYLPGQIHTLLYPASGGSCDWAYGEVGAFSLTVEVRDTGGYGFVMPPEEIVPNAEENLAGIVALAERALAPAAFLVPEVPVRLVPGELERVPLAIVPFRGEILPGTAVLRAAVDDGPLETIALDPIAGGGFEAPLPAIACGETLRWHLEVETDLGPVRFPEAGAANPIETPALGEEVVLFDPLEVESGWIVGADGDDATSGVWERVVPIATSAQPGEDHTPDGVVCFITGQHPGGGVGANDVDNGATTLTSPALDASEPGTEISVWLWYSNTVGANPGSDSMLIEASADGGPWTLLEEIAESPGVWFERRWRLDDLLPPADSVRVRFVARDLGGGSLVEAGVDDLTVLRTGCPDVAGDLDGDGLVGGADLAILIGLWGTGDPAADLDGDGSVGGGDLSALLAAWS